MIDTRGRERFGRERFCPCAALLSGSVSHAQARMAGKEKHTIRFLCYDLYYIRFEKAVFGAPKGSTALLTEEQLAQPSCRLAMASDLMTGSLRVTVSCVVLIAGNKHCRLAVGTAIIAALSKWHLRSRLQHAHQPAQRLVRRPRGQPASPACLHVQRTTHDPGAGNPLPPAWLRPPPQKALSGGR
jgi:hypothetical protein